MQPLNQVQTYPGMQQGNQQAPANSNTGAPATVKMKIEGNCRYCNIVGHKVIECRKRLRNEDNGINTKTYQRPR